MNGECGLIEFGFHHRFEHMTAAQGRGVGGGGKSVRFSSSEIANCCSSMACLSSMKTLHRIAVIVRSARRCQAHRGARTHCFIAIDELGPFSFAGAAFSRSLAWSGSASGSAALQIFVQGAPGGCSGGRLGLGSEPRRLAPGLNFIYCKRV
jgi:hypothetical protein